MIENVQDLLTRLTTIDAAAERRFPISAATVRLRTDAMRTGVDGGMDLDQLRDEAISCKGYAFMGSGAGMKWLDKTWGQLVDAFPVPVDVAEIAAHLTADLMEANR